MLDIAFSSAFTVELLWQVRAEHAHVPARTRKRRRRRRRSRKRKRRKVYSKRVQ